MKIDPPDYTQDTDDEQIMQGYALVPQELRDMVEALSLARLKMLAVVLATYADHPPILGTLPLDLDEVMIKKVYADYAIIKGYQQAMYRELNDTEYYLRMRKAMLSN